MKSGCRGKGEEIKKNGAALGQGPGSPPQGVYINILELLSDTETRTRWGRLTACCSQARMPQNSQNQADADSRYSSPPSTGEECFHRADHCAFLKGYANFTTLLGSGHSFEDVSLRSSLPGKAIKLSFQLHPKLCLQGLVWCWGFRGQDLL